MRRGDRCPGGWGIWRAIFIAEASDGVVGAGTTGESPTLAVDEKVMLFRTVVEAVGDRESSSPAPVYLRHGRVDSCHQTRLQRRRPRRDGSDAVLLPTTATRSLRTLHGDANASTVPMLVYNIPFAPGAFIEVATCPTRCASQDRCGQGCGRGPGVYDEDAGRRAVTHSRSLLRRRRHPHHSDDGGRCGRCGVRRLAPSRQTDQEDG